MIVFIVGLPRSGTTYLQSQFLNFDKVVALGEVALTIYAIKNVENISPKWKLLLRIRNKSHWNSQTYPILLERIRRDSFWSKIEEDIRSTNTIKEAIELVYSRAVEQYPDHIFIDSSKSINHLKTIMTSKEYQTKLYVLHCIRDYRGWLYSIKKHKKRLNYSKKSNLLEVYTWLFANKRILKFLRTNFNNRHLIISYDKMIFSYQQSIEKIAAVMNLSLLKDGKSENEFHEILGSQSFKKSINRNELVYDSEWFEYNSKCFEIFVQIFNRRMYKKHLN